MEEKQKEKRRRSDTTIKDLSEYVVQLLPAKGRPVATFYFMEEPSAATLLKLAQPFKGRAVKVRVLKVVKEVGLGE